jgi:PAS domain S-box-containing protein
MKKIQTQGPLGFVLVYAAISGLWILFSDRLLYTFIHNESLNLALQTYKGWFFVAVTSLIGYWALKRRDHTVKETQEALRQSNELYRVLIETTGTGYVIIGTDGIVKNANREYLRLCGYKDLEEILGRSVLEWTSADKRVENADALKSCNKKGSIRNFETDYVDRSGNIIPVEINATTITTDNMPLIFALCRDVSERKRDLEEKQTLEMQLIRAQKMEAIGTLAGGIAHDFNNLMSGLFGYIDIALEYAQNVNESSKIKYCLEKSMSVFQRAKALTAQLLTFSKGEAPVKKTVSLAPLLKDTASFALSGANVNAVFNIPEDLWFCDVDEHQINQVIDNLVINARQAMPTGGTITISAENVYESVMVAPTLPSGHYVRISIKDQGCGIPSKYLPRLFEPFFTTKQTGSGLGLATSYSIISKHDGLISVESVPGKGSNFLIFLPASKSRLIENDPENNGVYNKGSGKILIMDDEPHICEVASMMMKNMGYTVTTASNGIETVDIFRKACESSSSFDLVVLDLTVPGGLGGKEVLRKILDIDPKARVVASSGYSDDPIMANPAAFGFAGKISKPYTRMELAKVLNKVINQVSQQ